jgi:hypothetical protein
VGRPRKDTEVVLFKPKIKSTPSTKNIRGPYTNWFTLSFWPPIYVVMKQHSNIFSALKYLRGASRKLGKIDGVYDHLSRGSLVEWFHPNGKIKENYKHHVKLDTTFAKFL